MKSTTKVWGLLIFLSLTTIVVGYHFFDRWGLLAGFFIAVTFNALVLTRSKNYLHNKLKAREVRGQDAWNLNDRVAHWSREVAIQPPKVFLIESASATAYSDGSPWGDSSICLTTALLEKLTPEEVEAVLVHQLCHILALDTLSFGAASIVAHSLVSLADVLDLCWPLRYLPKFKRQKPFHHLISPLAWVLIRLNVRESTFFANDDLAAGIIKDRRVLAKALWKLESLSQAVPLEIPDCSSHLFVVNPRGFREMNWFYLTHPRMSSRLQRMIGYEPI